MNGNVLAGAPLAAAGQTGSSGLVTFLPLLLLVVAFYFFVIRPTRNRQREAASLQSSLQPGQQVMTTSGVYGRVVAIEDDAVAIEVSPGVTMRWAKAAVARVVTPAAGTPGAETTGPETAGPDTTTDGPGH